MCISFLKIKPPPLLHYIGTRVATLVTSTQILQKPKLQSLKQYELLHGIFSILKHVYLAFPISGGKLRGLQSQIAQ